MMMMRSWTLTVLLFCFIAVIVTARRYQPHRQVRIALAAARALLNRFYPQLDSAVTFTLIPQLNGKDRYNSINDGRQRLCRSQLGGSTGVAMTAA